MYNGICGWGIGEENDDVAQNTLGMEEVFGLKCADWSWYKVCGVLDIVDEEGIDIIFWIKKAEDKACTDVIIWHCEYIGVTGKDGIEGVFL